MAITTIDGLVDALANAQTKRAYQKHNVTTQGGGFYVSLWMHAGMPGAAATPTPGVGGEVPTDATAGAIPFTNPTGGDFSYLFYGLYVGAIGLLLIYDRLWQNSGLSVTDTNPQTVNSSALTRPDANGDDVEAWMHIYTNMGAGANAPTITYTNQAGTGSRTGAVAGYAASALAHRNFPITLQSGDTGVRSIQSWTNSATFTSGTIGAVLRRLIMLIPNVWRPGPLDLLACGLPRIPDDACLEVVWWSQSSSLPTDIFLLHIVNG